jgi:hypothetical protein
MLKDLFPPSSTPGNLAGAALKTFFNIAELWQLTDYEQRILLGGLSKTIFSKWKRGQCSHLSHDTLERISYILGIYKALQILLPDAQTADAWIHKPNASPLFAGQSALKRMLSGNVSDLFLIREYLDAQHGGRI